MAVIYETASEALRSILQDGVTIMAGGFGLCGIPENCIDAICESGVRDLTVISNNCGTDNYGLGKLLHNDQIKKMVASYTGENKTLAKKLFAGELEVELIPQGTLAEKIRSGGAGIPAFYTRTGAGTMVAEGKDIRFFNNIPYLMEHTLFADIAIIKGYKADKSGNVVYHRTARNFNPIMATAARVTVVEVEEIVEIGELDPDSVHTPGIFVHRLVKGDKYEKRIENLVLREN
jgi:3-oxoacid CoA-transferase subunit A